MIQTCLDNGFPSNRADEFRSFFHEILNIFRSTFSKVPPANVPPHNIESTDDTKPICVKIRSYIQSRRQFLRRIETKLEDVELNYPNPTSKWACASHLVPKAGPDAWRFTVDVRPVNQYTVPIKLILPAVEHGLDETSGSLQSCNLDMPHSYWQFLFHASSQEF